MQSARAPVTDARVMETLGTEEGRKASDAHNALPDPAARRMRALPKRGLESCNKFSLLMQSRVTSPFLGEPANRVWIEIQNLIQRPSLSDSGVTLFSPYGM